MADTGVNTDMEGLAGLFEADAVKDKAPQVYEIGYHLLPTLSEAEVTSTVKDLMAFLTKEGASFIGDKAPEKIDLAYAIERRVEGKFQAVRSAFFGWVAFEVSPNAAQNVKKFMDTNPAVLRYIFIVTTKDEVKAVMEGKVLVPKAAASTDAIAAPKRAEEEGGEVSQVDLDKALDTMTEEKEA
jgi:ribosomal protein S6